jgi:hypothetical protein
MNDHGMLKGSTGVVWYVLPKSMVASLNRQNIINTKSIDWNHKRDGKYVTSFLTTPWGHEKITPIKALSMASLIMVDASNCVFLQLQGHRGRASMSSSACGRLLRLDESFSRMISSILAQSNLFALWTISVVFISIHSEWRHPQQLRGWSIFMLKKWGAKPMQVMGGPSSLGRPAWAYFNSVRSPLLLCGSSRRFLFNPL